MNSFNAQFASLLELRQVVKGSYSTPSGSSTTFGAILNFFYSNVCTHAEKTNVEIGIIQLASEVENI